MGIPEKDQAGWAWWFILMPTIIMPVCGWLFGDGVVHVLLVVYVLTAIGCIIVALDLQ